MRVVGYADALSVEPGAELRFMVSCSAPTYRTRLVRLIHGDDNPKGPGFKSELQGDALAGEHAGIVQPLRPGSCARIPARPDLRLTGSFDIELWIFPTLLAADRAILISQNDGDAGFALGLSHDRLFFEDRTTHVTFNTPVQMRLWSHIRVAYDQARGEVQLRLTRLDSSGQATPAEQNFAFRGRVANAGEMVIAAEQANEPRDYRSFFNGKIAGVTLRATKVDADNPSADSRRLKPSAEEPSLLAQWDFSRGIGTTDVIDTSLNGFHGCTVNRPTRAVTGPHWDHSEVSWRARPDQYGAIHFHDDDLDDAGWEPSLSWRVPDDMKSGVYALHLLVDGGGEDYVPFFVRPGPQAVRADVALILPTFTYLAYANERMLDTLGLFDHPEYPQQDQDRFCIEQRLLSTYDKHSDGSGVCYSSRLKPIVNMRPRVVMQWLNQGRGSPHGFCADLYIVDFLHHSGIQFDILTDEDWHAQGLSLLSEYKVLITGSHHEYCSLQMIRSAQAYLGSGGRLVHLSGNGMYWVANLDQPTGTALEIRRAGPAIRTWEAPPGEAHLSTTGEYGGIWRYRGCAAQSWLGVGTAAETSGPGRPYVRTPASFQAEFRFIFDGVEGEAIGDFPNLIQGYGAAGYEIDRADPALGTPMSATVLASATEFSAHAVPAPEDSMFSAADRTDAAGHSVRCDMVYLKYANGGAVFAPGSIAWSGALSYDDYRNEVASITTNVLTAFMTTPAGSNDFNRRHSDA